MYLCHVCNACSAPKEPRRLHVIQRVVPRAIWHPGGIGIGKYVEEGTRTEIEKEVPVCAECKKLLDSGITLQQLQAVHAKKRRTPQRLDAFPEVVRS